MSSTKSSTGHLLGAAGAIEAIFCLPGHARPDRAADHQSRRSRRSRRRSTSSPNKAQPLKIDVALSNSFGFGGTNAALRASRRSREPAEPWSLAELDAAAALAGLVGAAARAAGRAAWCWSPSPACCWSTTALGPTAPKGRGNHGDAAPGRGPVEIAASAAVGRGGALGPALHRLGPDLRAARRLKAGEYAFASARRSRPLLGPDRLGRGRASPDHHPRGLRPRSKAMDILAASPILTGPAGDAARGRAAARDL